MIFHHYFWASNWLIEWQIWSLKITLGFCFDIQSLCSEICLLDLLSLVILLSGDNLLLLHFENLLRKLKSGNKWSGIQNLQLKLYSQTFVHILSFNQQTPTTFQIARISLGWSVQALGTMWTNLIHRRIKKITAFFGGGRNHKVFNCLFLGSMLPQYMAFSVSFVCRKKFVCPFVGLHCGCVPPPLWKYVCPFVGLQCGQTRKKF